MMRRVSILLWVALAAGCTSTPAPSDGGSDAGSADSGTGDAGTNRQAQYAYPGCDGGSEGCPNDLTFVCAMDTIRDKYRSCSDAGDCVRPTVSNCLDWGNCQPVAVTAALLGSFMTEAEVQVARYCGGFPYSGCHEAGSCAVSYALGRVACIQSQCVGIQDDAGM